jgi:phage shock protein A
MLHSGGTMKGIMNCTSCGLRIEVPAEKVGSQVGCPQCKARVTVAAAGSTGGPSRAQAAPAPAPAEESGLAPAVVGAIVSSLVILVVAVVLLFGMSRQRAALEDRINSLEANLEGIAAPADNSSHERRVVEELQALRTAFNDQIHTLRTTNAEFANQLEVMELELERQSNIINTGNLSLEQLKDSLKQFENELTTMTPSGDTPEVSPIFKRIEQKQEKLLGSLTALASELKELERGQVEQADGTDEIQGRLDSLAAAIKEMENQMSLLKMAVLKGGGTNGGNPAPAVDPATGTPPATVGNADLATDLQEKYIYEDNFLTISIVGLVTNNGDAAAINARAVVALQIVRGVDPKTNSPILQYPQSDRTVELGTLAPGSAMPMKASFRVPVGPADPDTVWTATYDVRFEIP